MGRNQLLARKYLQEYEINDLLYKYVNNLRKIELSLDVLGEREENQQLEKAIHERFEEYEETYYQLNMYYDYMLYVNYEDLVKLLSVYGEYEQADPNTVYVLPHRFKYNEEANRYELVEIGLHDLERLTQQKEITEAEQRSFKTYLEVLTEGYLYILLQELYEEPKVVYAYVQQELYQTPPKEAINNYPIFEVKLAKDIQIKNHYAKRPVGKDVK